MLFLARAPITGSTTSEEKVADAYAKYRAAQRGTVLHSFAAQCIKAGSTATQVAKRH